MTEERMNEVARNLGTRAAERLDVAATARRVLEQLRQPPVRRTVWIQQSWLRIAATLVLLLGGSYVIARRVRPVMNTHGEHYVADDLGDLSTEQLRDVLMTLDEVTSDSVVVPESTTDLQELDARQLRAVLRSLEG